jgi:pyridoxine/pyridoxamine 5'-phosphate oxidase
LWSRGVADRRSPFHSPMVATVGLDGRPRARVVILRGCSQSERRVRFHTDMRSAKAAELLQNPFIALTGYDHGAKIQIRLEGRASLHREDALADAAWEGSRPFSRICYGVAPGPGTRIGEGGAFALPAGDDEIAGGRAHFCAVQVAVESLEWLYLAHSGHRRARYTFAGDAVTATWLAP